MYLLSAIMTYWLWSLFWMDWLLLLHLGPLIHQNHLIIGLQLIWNYYTLVNSYWCEIELWKWTFAIEWLFLFCFLWYFTRCSFLGISFRLNYHGLFILDWWYINVLNALVLHFWFCFWLFLNKVIIWNMNTAKFRHIIFSLLLLL